MENIKIFASGDKWIGQGVTSTFAIFSDLIDSANNSLLLTIYVLSSKEIYTKLIKAVERGIEVEIFIYFDENYVDIIRKLKQLSEKYYYVKIYVLKEEVIHSKIIISDKSRVALGSANLSFNALYKNYELGVFIEDKNIAYELENIIKRLL